MTVRDLAWTRDIRDERLRVPRFVRRAPLGFEKIAAMAHAVEQRAAQVLGAASRVDVFPPVILEAEQWPRLCADAHVFEVAYAVLVIGPRAARRIVACAFGETVACEQSGLLSPVEMRVLERFVEELASVLRTACSEPRLAAHERHPPTIYCEIRLSGALDIIIGVALREALEVPGPRLAAGALDACPIECTVRLGVATADILTIADLAVGNVIRLETKVGPSATLNLGPDPIAAGEGGVLGDRSAFKVHELI